MRARPGVSVVALEPPPELTHHLTGPAAEGQNMVNLALKNSASYGFWV